jgi:hypothetical protein
LPDDGFSIQPKHVARNKTVTHSVAVEGLYFPFAVLMSQGDVIDKYQDSPLYGDAAGEETAPGKTSDDNIFECRALTGYDDTKTCIQPQFLRSFLYLPSGQSKKVLLSWTTRTIAERMRVPSYRDLLN